MNEYKWWQNTAVYQIYPKSFNDTTGSGTGDLRGIGGPPQPVKGVGGRAQGEQNIGSRVRVRHRKHVQGVELGAPSG